MNLFKENHHIWPFFDGMDFDCISDIEIMILEKPFSENEILSTVMGMKGDKVPRSNSWF